MCKSFIINNWACSDNPFIIGILLKLENANVSMNLLLIAVLDPL